MSCREPKPSNDGLISERLDIVEPYAAIRGGLDNEEPPGGPEDTSARFAASPTVTLKAYDGS